MLHIHPNAHTMTRYYDISAETVRKCGTADCLDRSARPHRLPRKTTDEERTVVYTLHRTTSFLLGEDLGFIHIDVKHLPKL